MDCLVKGCANEVGPEGIMFCEFHFANPPKKEDTNIDWTFIESLG